MSDPWARGVDDRLDELTRAVAAIGTAITSGARGGPEEEGPRTTKDEVWACSRCSTRLALYDPEADLLRVRYKDFVAHIRTGAGGLIRIICRSCSEINEITHVDDRAPAPPAPSAPPSAGGRAGRR